MSDCRLTPPPFPMPMSYPLGEFETGQMNALLTQLDALYPNDVSLKLRKLIESALANGFLTDAEICLLLELLPMVSPQAEAEETPTADRSTGQDDWPEWDTCAAARRKRLYLQLQQHLSHLLFMQEAVHKVVVRREQGCELMNGII